MTHGTLAEDTVAIRRVHARGASDIAVRRQLAMVPIPATRRYVFVRRVVLRAPPDRIGPAMHAALSRLAAEGDSNVVAFADFPAVAVACAYAALNGELGGWQWRQLGVPRSAGPGEAIATLLLATPLQAGAVVAALAARGLLAAVWRDLSEPAAARLTVALAQAACCSPPPWPADADTDIDGSALSTGMSSSAVPLLAVAASFWAPVLAPLPHRHEAVRTAAILSLLRWSPMALRASGGPVWPALLSRIAAPSVPRRHFPRASDVAGASVALPLPCRAGAAAAIPDAGATAALPPAWQSPPAACVAPSAPVPAPASTRNAAHSAVPARGDSPEPGLDSLPHGEVVVTGWGGVLLLVNALHRLDLAGRLEALGAAAPSGWRVLHAIGVALGMPEDEPLAVFLAAQDLDTIMPTDLQACLLAALEATYAPPHGGPWPLPMALPGRLQATETHLDFDFATAAPDVAVRLAGLDLDPGWVPWLGRVVAFHYPLLVTQLLAW